MQNERYSRNILEIGEEGQKKLLNAKVLVCGAGGLGSTVILNLASLGIGHIGIVDNDVLELSNLNRQYIHDLSSLGKPKVISAKNRIENYNKDIEVKTFQTRLDEKNYEQIVKDYDIIVDCFDSYKSKLLLNDIALKTGKTLVHGGVSGIRGQVMTIIPHKSACLRCILPDDDEYVVKGVLSPAVSLIASFESLEVAKLILNNEKTLTNSLLIFDGLNARVVKVQKASDCHNHVNFL